LTAWGLAGVAGPSLVSFFRETVGGYTVTLYCFAAFFVLNLAIALLLKAKGRQSVSAWQDMQSLG
jgi:OFA family oxalate/formate antiporter-like MFS transporter